MIITTTGICQATALTSQRQAKVGSDKIRCFFFDQYLVITIVIARYHLFINYNKFTLFVLCFFSFNFFFFTVVE